jgi:UDP-glucose 4-epimerase
MSAVAVTGAAGLVGRALLERLDADPAVTRILGIDVVEPQMPVAKLELRMADLRDPLLSHALRDADTVVHLGATYGPDRDEDTMFAVNVHGTRHALAGAEKAGAGVFVHLSSAAVYGAHPDNRVPLDEDAPLRANPDHALAHQQLLAEQLVADWAAANPDTAVSVLRAARTVGPGQDDPTSRALESPRLVRVRGTAPPQQYVHADDLAAALHLAVTERLRGAFNVASDGWVSAEEAEHLLGRHVLDLPEAVAFEVVAALWRWGLISQPAAGLHFAMFPCVVSARRLHHAGWSASRSNREILREFAAEHHAYLAMGRVRLRRRDVYGAALAAATALFVRRALRRR